MVDSVQADNGGALLACFRSHDPLLQLCLKCSLFSSLKKRNASLFHRSCTKKNLLFSAITSGAFYFSCLVRAAPEVLSGGPYSHAADWWSLGVLLFALVTGKVRLHKRDIYLFKNGLFFYCVITSSLSFQYPQSSITSPC